ncbi:PleD family two-component system response regulator [Candidatus Omnitrophota bacterium]
MRCWRLEINIKLSNNFNPLQKSQGSSPRDVMPKADAPSAQMYYFLLGREPWPLGRGVPLIKRERKGMESKKTILVVDDDAELRKVLLMRLSEAGYETIEASNGKEALNIARERKLDLIILDIMMPDMDGMATSQQLKGAETTKNIPIIFLSALVDKTTETPDLGIGQNIIFAKPYNSNELLAVIKKLIGESKS